MYPLSELIDELCPQTVHCYCIYEIIIDLHVIIIICPLFKDTVPQEKWHYIYISYLTVCFIEKTNNSAAVKCSRQSRSRQTPPTLVQSIFLHAREQVILALLAALNAIHQLQDPPQAFHSHQQTGFNFITPAYTSCYNQKEILMVAVRHAFCVTHVVRGWLGTFLCRKIAAIRNFSSQICTTHTIFASPGHCCEQKLCVAALIRTALHS